jgi:hypothetical protein
MLLIARSNETHSVFFTFLYSLVKEAMATAQEFEIFAISNELENKSIKETAKRLVR